MIHLLRLAAFCGIAWKCLAIGGMVRSVAAATVGNLQVEHVAVAMGVDVPQPVLSWNLLAAGEERGLSQSAYQVLVASTAEGLAKDQADLWDSGKVKSDDSLGVLYTGKPLASARRIFWKVRVWDQADAPTAWSAAGNWTMGLLAEADWSGKWIGGGGTPGNDTVLLRREFAIKAGLTRATLYVCGLGQYEATLNGKKVGDDLLTPGWTNYRKTCLYDTYDVTPMLREGKNAAGLFLGNGMYNVQKGRYTKFTGTFGPLKAIAHLRLEYADGTSQIVATDDQWQTRPGPMTFCNVFGGEDFDARLVEKGWDEAAFGAGLWQQAKVTPGPGGMLRGLSCAAPPIRMFEVLKPFKATALRPGVTVYDMGQNASLMPRIKVGGATGGVVRIIPAELVKADGSVDRQSVGGGQAYWQYTLAGTGNESWFPKFFYHGSRYLQVELTAAPGGGLPTVDALEAVVVHAASPPAGEITTSSDLFNKVHTLVRWAQVSNMMSVMTDCPHRERLGWLEQIHLNGPALRYEFDMTHYFHKVVNDIADSQTANGLVPDIAPEFTVFSGGFRDSPEWGSALPVMAWQQYDMSGDSTLLTRYYDNMKRYVDYLSTKAAADIVSHGLGDWYDIGPKPPGQAQLTPTAATATAFYFADAQIVAKTARIMGRSADATKYDKLAADIRAAYNTKFYDAAKGSYSTGSQTANSIPLAMNIAEDANRSKILGAVVADVQNRGLTAGDVGYRYLLRALAEGGRSDVIFTMNNQSDKPGYGMQLKKGATSLTEAWDARPASSQNHFMLGQIVEWFYHDLAGIRAASPGFKSIEIQPAMPGDISFVNASYACPYGTIASYWKRDAKTITMEITIPPNTAATVHVPAKDGAAITEGPTAAAAVPAEKSAGVTLIRRANGEAVFQVGSGRYNFHTPL